MKFSSDSQRRAVFRNMFSNSNRFSKQKYYHGSAGFGGRVILAEGLKPVAQQEDGPRSGGQISDPDYVYLTSDKKVAKDFANRVSDYFKDDDYGPIVFEVDMESTYLEPDYNYPKSYKYKGSIPREVLKRVKFSEDPEELSEWQKNHNKQQSMYRDMIFEGRKDNFKEDLGLPIELYTVIANNEDKLLKLKVNADLKDIIYEENEDGLRASGKGRKAGALLRAKYKAYDKYSDTVGELLKKANIDDKVSTNFLRIDRYLNAEAIKNKLKNDGYYDGIPEAIEAEESYSYDI